VEFEGEVVSVRVPGSKGNFEILVDHAPIISLLDNGVVEYVSPSGEKSTLSINGGFVEVQRNVVSLCVEVGR
jgi:F-type H+-transporting ATPase subunit epsilon